MINFLLKLIGDPNEKKVKKISGIIDHINALEPEFEKLSDEELRAKTDEFKAILAKRPTSDNAKADRILEKEALDKILPEAFATVREAGKRVLNMRHFDVQLIGAYFLHNGHIAEMRTGEGKTLVATLAAYLNALTGKGVHVVTVNDYLAKRDSEWMGKIYKFLGLSVGVILSNQHDADEFNRKRAAYACDITYGTNNEFGFDYLRDNMAANKEMLVQRPFNYAIIDEVDSILIDEARTPLIISGRVEKSADTYTLMAKVAPQLNKDSDYEVDEKNKNVILTEDGIDRAQEIIGCKDLFDINNQYAHDLLNALKAKELFIKDTDYVVKDGEIMIVDEFTGRLMPGRRWSDGLHQAIEAKEGVEIQDETQTLASITFQNLFRLYPKLSGMTGTAMTEEAEFGKIYNLEVTVIPTNKPDIRINYPDVIYKTERAKYNAVVNDIIEQNKLGRPVLVGTVSIEKSEYISALLKKKGVKHNVLNAKQHEKEAYIIAQAGRVGAVTIATNMAGRGTDILLGGNAEFLAKEELETKGILPDSPDYEKLKVEALKNARAITEEEHAKVIELGGLHVIGTERHESRRIDNQLRGRSGRQGDVGESRFFIGLDDDLMKIFGGDTITKVYNTLGADESMPIESRIISKAVENAQKKVEGRNFAIRKNVLKYDDVNNVQREIIYKQRREVLDGENLKDNMINMINSVADETVAPYIDVEKNVIDVEPLDNEIQTNFGIFMREYLKENEKEPEKVKEELKKQAIERYEQKEKDVGDQMRELERVILLKVVDEKWMNHIDGMEELKDGIGLRAYGQQDPVVKYRMEGMDMFEEMISNIKFDVVKILMHIRSSQGEVKRQEAAKITGAALEAINSVDGGEKMNVKENQTVRNEGPKVGRNDPCPCGSGKKYKNCCGKNA